MFTGIRTTHPAVKATGNNKKKKEEPAHSDSSSAFRYILFRTIMVKTSSRISVAPQPTGKLV